jgi:hypothetical protein
MDKPRQDYSLSGHDIYWINRFTLYFLLSKASDMSAAKVRTINDPAKLEQNHNIV